MIPIVGAFRGLFLGSVLVWYSSSVWKTMDNYYNQEFKKYLQKEKEQRRFQMDEDVCRMDAAAPLGERASCHAEDAVPGGEDSGGGETAPLTLVPDGADAAGAVSRDATPEGDSVADAEEQVKLETHEDVNGDTCPAMPYSTIKIT